MVGLVVEFPARRVEQAFGVVAGQGGHAVAVHVLEDHLEVLAGGVVGVAVGHAHAHRQHLVVDSVHAQQFGAVGGRGVPGHEKLLGDIEGGGGHVAALAGPAVGLADAERGEAVEAHRAAQVVGGQAGRVQGVVDHQAVRRRGVDAQQIAVVAGAGAVRAGVAGHRGLAVPVGAEFLFAADEVAEERGDEEQALGLLHFRRVAAVTGGVLAAPGVVAVAVENGPVVGAGVGGPDRVVVVVVGAHGNQLELGIGVVIHGVAAGVVGEVAHQIFHIAVAVAGQGQEGDVADRLGVVVGGRQREHRGDVVRLGLVAVVDHGLIHAFTAAGMAHDADFAHVQFAGQHVQAAAAGGVDGAEFVQVTHHQHRAGECAGVAVAGAAVVIVDVVGVHGNHRIAVAGQIAGDVFVTPVAGDRVGAIVVVDPPAVVAGAVAAVQEKHHREGAGLTLGVLDVAVDVGVVAVPVFVVHDGHAAEMVLLFGDGERAGGCGVGGHAGAHGVRGGFGVGCVFHVGG